MSTEDATLKNEVEHDPTAVDGTGETLAVLPHDDHQNDAVEDDDAHDDVKKDEIEQERTSRRFFPRVKQLVNPEWEHFLQGVLHSVQAHQAHTVMKASGVEDNAWYQVFHAVYGGIAADNCSVPQGKNRYHKFKDKIVELWRYMAVTEPPAHDTDARLWKMGRSQWEMYKNLLVVAGKSPVDVNFGGDGSPGRGLKKRGPGRPRGSGNSMSTAYARGAGGTSVVRYEAPPKKNYLPSPLYELHAVWKMSLKHNDPVEMEYIRRDYQASIKMFTDECYGGPETPPKLLFHLEGLNELREIEQEADMKKLIGDTYKNVLQRYLIALNKKRGLGTSRKPSAAAAAAAAAVAAAQQSHAI